MTQAIHISLNKSVISLSSVPLLVLPMQVCALNTSQDKGDSKSAEADSMAKRIFWANRHG